MGSLDHPTAHHSHLRSRSPLLLLAPQLHERAQRQDRQLLDPVHNPVLPDPPLLLPDRFQLLKRYRQENQPFGPNEPLHGYQLRRRSEELFELLWAGICLRQPD